MTRIAIIVGSTRPNRVGRQVGDWVNENAQRHGEAEFELVDLVDQNLPLLDEPLPPAMGQYENEHTKAWAEKIASYDGFIFVTPEYNHSVPGAMKNAIDYLYAEWNNKAAGIVSYGSAMGVRAAEHLRGILSELQIAHVQKTGLLSIFTDFEYPNFKPSEQGISSVDAMLEQLVVWTKAMSTIRESANV